MIRLTRINNVELVLNADLIEHIESNPDTMVSLSNGQRIIVKESPEQVVERVVAYRRKILEGLCPLDGQSRATAGAAGVRNAIL